MNRLFVMVLVMAGLAMALTPPAHAQEEPDEIEENEESGSRLGETEARRILAEELAPGASSQQQAEYYLRRERAAFTVGDSGIRLDALRRLVSLTEAPDKLSPYIGYLWREEWRCGNHTEALKLGESLVRNPAAAPLERINWTALLGRDYATLGKHERAADLLKQVEAEGKELRDIGGPHSVAYTALSNQLLMHTEILRAVVLQFQGNPEGALTAIRRGIAASHIEVERSRAAAVSSRSKMEYDTAIRLRHNVMGTAVDLYFNQGRNEEAEEIARLGLRLSAEERTGGVTEGFWHGKLAKAFLGERRFEEAITAAIEALDVLRASAAVKSSSRIINTQISLMQALFGMERWADADRLATEMLAATADDPTASARVDNSTLQAFLHLKNGRLAQARERIDSAVRYRQRNYGEKIASTIEARAVRALVLHAQGAASLALEDYRAVLEYVFAPESTFGDAQPAGVRGFYLPQAMRGFLALVRERHAKEGANIDEELVSLRHAQLDLVEGHAGADFSHPFFWAPYALYGDPKQ